MRNSVLATLAYYDVLDFPLKAEEVLRYLVKIQDVVAPDEVSLLNVRKVLDQLILDKIVDRDGNYYFLHGRDYLVPLRIKREKISRKKWRRALGNVRWLKFTPYTKAVFASGSLALNNCDELSDLDVLIVTKHGRIWLTRFLITAGLSIIGTRRKPFDRVAPDKICLNHYITDRSLRIPFESLYNAQTYVNLKPLLIRQESIVERFYRGNPWLARFLQHYDMMMYHNAGQEAPVRPGWLAKVVSGFLGVIFDTRLGDWFEQAAKRYQVRRIETNPLTKSLKGHVVYTDDQLAFHPDSTEGKILEKYQKLLTDYGLMVSW